MDVRKSEVIGRCCEANDLVGQKLGILLWCLPTLAFLLALGWNAARPWLWAPALLIMGIGCVVNARRCGRLHCYITGPIFILAAVYVMLAEGNVVPLRPNTFALVVLAAALLVRLAEVPLGRYWRSV